MLRGLAAGGLQDGAGRARGNPARHGPGVIVRTAQGCPRSRNGILKLADADHGIDRRCYRGPICPGVGQRVGGRVGGQVDRGKPAVGLGAEAFGRLADPDHDGSARTKLVHEAAPGRVRARSAIRCSQSATIWRVISAAGLIRWNEPTTWPMKNDSRRSAPTHGGLPALMDGSASRELWRHTRSNVLIVNPDAPGTPSVRSADAELPRG